MLAVALDDFSVTVVDTDTRRTVRLFTGHLNTVTDMVCHCHRHEMSFLCHSMSVKMPLLAQICYMCFYTEFSVP